MSPNGMIQLCAMQGSLRRMSPQVAPSAIR
jgi:hypothetical protein